MHILQSVVKCGRQKNAPPQENNLPHREVKGENENPWTGDRGGGGKNVSEISKVPQRRRIEGRIIPALLFLYALKTVTYNIIGQSSILVQTSPEVIWSHGLDIKNTCYVKT